MFLSVLLRCSLTSLTANKRKQIDQVVRYLEDRLRELDEEKEELKKYQQLDKQRRSLEYTILDHELNDARNELASVILPFCYICLLRILDNFYSGLMSECLELSFDEQTIHCPLSWTSEYHLIVFDSAGKAFRCLLPLIKTQKTEFRKLEMFSESILSCSASSFYATKHTISKIFVPLFDWCK
jgi:hypothetical protein